MNVILCHADDPPAAWLATALRARAVPLEVVTVEELVYSRRIVFRQDRRGDAGSVTLHDGRVLKPEAIDVLVNRVRYLPTAHFARAAPAERAYGEAELGALMLGWLNAIAGRVLNPAQPCALGGAGASAAKVIHAAALAGLPTAPWRADDRTNPWSPDGGRTPPADGEAAAATAPRSTHSAIVLDACVHGPRLPRDLQRASRRLAALLGVPLLQVDLHRAASGGWRFAHATGAVDFRLGGASLVRAIATAMSPHAAA